MRRMIFLLGALLLPSLCLGAHKAEEMCFIHWGDGSGELKIAEPSHKFDNYPPRDSGDDYMNSVGPDMNYVDRFENLYIYSSYFQQFKCFNNRGKLQFDYSIGSPSYDPEYYKKAISQIYVDSSGMLYVVGGPRDYIPVIDQEGKIIEKISPPDPKPGSVIYNVEFICDGKMSIYYGTGDFHCATYTNGVYTKEGLIGRQAKNGIYFNVEFDNNTRVTNFYKDKNPIYYYSCVFSNRASFYYDKDIGRAKFLGVDNNTKIYLLAYPSFYSTGLERIILIFDDNFVLDDKIFLPPSLNKYVWSIEPFVCSYNGNIYEFRILDDGLDVVKWTKE